MTDAARRAYWFAVQRRVGQYQERVQRAFIRAFTLIADGMTDSELARFIERGGIDRFVLDAVTDEQLDKAMDGVRAALRSSVGRSANVTAKFDMGRKGAELATPFNYLSPRVIDGIRELETQVLARLRAGVRETLRDAVEEGLRNGEGPLAIARGLRDTVGLAPNQREAVANFERMLADSDTEALTRALRDRRFDGAIKRAFGKGGLTPDQLERYVDLYRNKMISFHAETLARTTTLEATKLGQRLAWSEAVDRGIVDRARLMKRWVGVKDDRERDEHLAMEGEVVPFDEPFSNGQMIPGETDYNCRCLALYFEEHE